MCLIVNICQMSKMLYPRAIVMLIAFASLYTSCDSDLTCRCNECRHVLLIALTIPSLVSRLISVINLSD